MVTKIYQTNTSGWQSIRNFFYDARIEVTYRILSERPASGQGRLVRIEVNSEFDPSKLDEKLSARWKELSIEVILSEILGGNEEAKPSPAL